MPAPRPRSGSVRLLLCRREVGSGLGPAIADAIAANQRPAGMARVKDAFGERSVVDLVGAVGYYSLVSMTLNVAQVPLPAGVTPPLT
jgi:hypothetical protein